MKAPARCSKWGNVRRTGSCPRPHLRPKNDTLLTDRRSTGSVFGPDPSTKSRQRIPERVCQRVRDHFDAATHAPYRRLTGFTDKWRVKISNEVTARLTESQVIWEKMPEPKTRRLYQYLDWTIRMNRDSRTAAVVEGANGGKMLLIDVELHDRRRHDLYALCSPLDTVQSARSVQWQLISLLTAAELADFLGIDAECLPRGVRAASPLFEEHRNAMGDMKALKRKILDNEDRAKWTQNLRKWSPKCCRLDKYNKIKTVKSVKVSRFHDAVRRSLEDENVDLVPIVSRKTKSKKFSVDYLLPVRLGSDWVGTVYRDNEFVSILYDRYHVTNKAILCDPSFDVECFEWFQNAFAGLKIVEDDAESVAPQSAFSDSSSDADTVVVSPSHSEQFQNPPSLAAPCWTVQYVVPILVPLDVQGLQEYLRRLVRDAEQNKVYYGQFIENGRTMDTDPCAL